MHSLSPFLVFMASSFLKNIPINPTYGGVCFTTIFLKTNAHQKTLSQKPLKSEITLQDELFCDFH